MFKRRTPLAWKNLTHDWRRLAVALAGIAFAVLLMFTQVGFQNALFDSQVKVIDDLQGDIFLSVKQSIRWPQKKDFRSHASIKLGHALESRGHILFTLN